MRDSQFFTIEQLEREANVSVRNIRYYTAEGLLPPPEARGRYALYTTSHLKRLRLIQRLKDALLPLATIKAYLDRITDEELDTLEPDALAAEVAERQREAPPASSELAATQGAQAPGSAADYIRKVLERGNASMQAPAAPSEWLSEQHAAIPRLSDTVDAPAGENAYDSVSKERATQPLLPEWKAESIAEAHKTAVAVETWEHIELMPGVELHAHTPLSLETQEFLSKVLAYAQTVRPSVPRKE